MIHITIPGEPCAQSRPRATVINGKARVYEHKKSRSWKGMARVAMQEAGAPFIADGPVELHLRIFHACPKSDYRKRVPAPMRWRTKKPDIDNVEKAVKDAATGVLWRDDAQVVRKVSEQFTAPQGEAPRVEIRYRAIDGSAA